MRTPGVLIFGLVLAPCGWILDLTSTVSPSWRNVQYIAGQPQDLVLQQGLWDICRTFTTSRNIYCNQQDREYFANQIVTTSQKLMVTSLVINLIGLVVVSAGVKCWSDIPPNWTVTGIGGFLVFFSGILTLVPIAWFTHMLHEIKSPSTDVHVGYCIVLGYIGSLMNVLGGGAMFAGIHKCCGGLNRGEMRSKKDWFGADVPPGFNRNRSSPNRDSYSRNLPQESQNEFSSPQRSLENELVNTSYSHYTNCREQHSLEDQFGIVVAPGINRNCSSQNQDSYSRDLPQDNPEEVSSPQRGLENVQDNTLYSHYADL